MRPTPWASRTEPASPKMHAWVSPRRRAAACASRPPTPTILMSFSGSQPIFLASMRANTQVVEPTTVTPMEPPLRSSIFLIWGPTVSVKWFFSRMVAIARMPVPRSRNTSGSVAPVSPMSAAPDSTPLSRSGPPLNGTISASRSFCLKKPFSRPIRVGALIPRSPRTTQPTFTAAAARAVPGRHIPVVAAAVPPATVLRKLRRVVAIDRPPVSAPAREALVEMFERQYHDDGEQRHDQGGREQLGSLEGHGHALHEEAHAARAREHLGQQHTQHCEHDPHPHARQDGGQHGRQQHLAAHLSARGPHGHGRCD